MIQLRAVDKTILKHLVRQPNGWFDSFVLHELYLLSPGQVSNAICNLAALNLAELGENGAIRITKPGLRWVIENRKLLFMSSPERPWITAQQNIDKVDTNQPRLPSLGKVDRVFFEALAPNLDLHKDDVK